MISGLEDAVYNSGKWLKNLNTVKRNAEIKLVLPGSSDIEKNGLKVTISNVQTKITAQNAIADRDQ